MGFRLRLPAALAIVVLAPACGHGSSKVADAPRSADSAFCEEECIHTDDAQTDCGCASGSGACEPGCYACALFCLVQSNDAGVTKCPDCASPEGTCPTGCEPIG